MNTVEQAKYEKAYANVSRYGKDWTSGGRFHKNAARQYFTRGSSIVDIGCGNGSSVKWLREAGFKASGLDIARNAIKHIANGHICDITDTDACRELVKQHGQFDFGFCIDVMEHIPPSAVRDALSNIRYMTRFGCYFHIAQSPDLDGDAIGEILHLSLQDRYWWHAEIGALWPRVHELVQRDQKQYTLMALSDDMDAKLNARG